MIVSTPSSVGKTSLMQRYVHNRFSSSYKATIGADFLAKDIEVDGKSVTLQIWDTAGQERFQSLGVAFYRGAHACILCYDITDAKSFESLDSWKEEFLVNASPRNAETFPFIVIGNKLDRAAERAVTKNQVKQWCKQSGREIECFETSAKDATGIEKAFLRIAQLTLQEEDTKSEPVPVPDFVFPEANDKPANNGSCC